MKRLYIHVGIGKTGSTSIQHFLNSSQKKLSECGYLYPSSLGVGHAKIAQLFRSDEEVIKSPFFKRQKLYKTPSELRSSTLRDFQKEISENSAHNTLIVNETLYKLPADSFDRLIGFMRKMFDQIVLVMFVRRQEEVIVSSFKQSIVHGATSELETFVRRRIEAKEGNDQGFLLDYEGFLKGISYRHPEIIIKALVYHKELFKEKSLLSLFSDAVGLTYIDKVTPKGKMKNTSLDMHCAEYLRKYNEEISGRAAPSILVQSLKKISTSQDYDLGLELQQEIFERYRDGNIQLSNVHLKQGSSLFLAPPLRGEFDTLPTVDSQDLYSVHQRLVEQLCLEHQAQVSKTKNAWRKYSIINEELKNIKRVKGD